MVLPDTRAETGDAGTMRGRRSGRGGQEAMRDMGFSPEGFARGAGAEKTRPSVGSRHDCVKEALGQAVKAVGPLK